MKFLVLRWRGMLDYHGMATGLGEDLHTPEHMLDVIHMMEKKAVFDDVDPACWRTRSWSVYEQPPPLFTEDDFRHAYRQEYPT